jgi:hypothetical protein
MVVHPGIPRNRERHCRRAAALANGPHVDRRRLPKGSSGFHDPGEAGLVHTLGSLARVVGSVRWLGSTGSVRWLVILPLEMRCSSLFYPAGTP